MNHKHKHRGGNGHSAATTDTDRANDSDAPPAANTAEDPASPPEGPAEAAASSATPEIDVMRAELDALRNQYLRTAADFDNYRKRAEREKAESWVRAQSDLARAMLDALDDLQRIADFDPETTSARALHEGAEIAERKFLRALENAGLEVVDAAGKPFDPTMHEALTTVPTDVRDEDDTVADVFQKGYRFKGILLRPARVRVKKHA